MCDFNLRRWSLWIALVLGFAAQSAWADPPSYLDRELVAEVSHRAAVHAGLGGSPGSMALRARVAAFLPTVGFSYSFVQGGSLTDTTTVLTDRLVTNNSLVLGLHFSLALDRFLFDPHEAAIARADQMRAERVMALEALVVELLGRMEHARVARAALLQGEEPDTELELAAAIARARLELLIGGPIESVVPHPAR